jgi:hypothetical protein
MAKKHRHSRHAFRFMVGSPEDQKTITCWAKVVPAKQDVFLPLKAGHVEKSIKLKGVGNTQCCSMAVCAYEEKDCFPHQVHGYIDWFYSRAFVVSKLDKNGLPAECYAYMHSDNIAKLNDSKGGQKTLLAELKKGGDRIIHLRPVRGHDNKGPFPHRSRQDGSRTKVQPRGAKLRFAVAQMGGVG